MRKQKVGGAKPTKNAEEKYVGSEPKNCVLDKMGTIHAYNHFNYFHNTDKAIEFFEAYLTKLENSILLKKFKKFSKNLFPNNIGWLARMQMNGVTITKESEVYFVKFMKKLHDFEPVKVVEKVGTKVVSFENPFIIQLEAEHDKVARDLLGYKFNADIFFKINKISLADLKKICNYYEPILDELNSISTDASVREGYSSYSKKEIQALITFYSDIVNNTKEIKVDKARTRTTRKPKPVSVQKKLKKFRYLEKDNVLNISSISPSKVLTSSCMLLYNKERRKLYFVESPSTFDVSGVSIVNIDVTKSFSKTIRKPEAVKELLTGTKSAIARKFGEIKAVPAPVEKITTNADMLILRVFILILLILIF